MTPQMATTLFFIQLGTSVAVLIVVTCFVYPIIKRKTDRVLLWTLFCLVPALNGLAYILLLSKTDKDILARIKALEDGQRRP